MKEKKYKGISIKVITALYSVVAILVLTLVIVFTGYRLFEKKVMESYQKYALTVLGYAHSITTEYAFGDMITARDMPESYEKMREKLNVVKENSNIEYLYAIYFDDVDDIHSLTYAINTKTREELENKGTYTYLGTPCEEGSFADDTLLILQNAVKNRQKESGVLEGYSEGYGQMLNGYKVIYDSNDNPAGLLCVEIDINNITKDLDLYVREIAVFVAIFAFIVIILYIVKIEYSLVYPITSITNAAEDFIKNIGEQEAMDESATSLERLNIHSKNEVGNLYETVSRMETDMAKQLRDIRSYAENTLRMQDGLMILLADMVESRDSDTGAHIQKTADYVRIILNGLRKKGYYKEILTDQYIEDVIKSAPLHDIGKIRIADSILQKPGKLTEQEYEIMKMHSMYGKVIIDKAIRTVEGESFLKEARNMATHHHERWDGKGYPDGLKGEEIPLSARVMAVADVFDALTSRRVYKPAFQLSDAIAIIESENGHQFDPKCVEVFLEAMPEIKEIMKNLNPEYEG